MKPIYKAHTLIRQLRTLEPRELAPVELTRVAGGDFASTSTSGTPEAGDDTIGDSGGTLIPVTIKHNV